MNWWPRTLSLRLAMMFALVSAQLLGAVGFYLYHSLQREIAWRDDQALLGRLARIQAMIHDSANLNALRTRPQLYDSMLGNRDGLLWVVDENNQLQIDINPLGLPRAFLPPAPEPRLADSAQTPLLRLAWLDVVTAQHRLTLITGKYLGEREQMLSVYRIKVLAALTIGAVLAFLLGWLVSLRGLRPVRQLAMHAATIDVQHLHLRLTEFQELNELNALSRALNQMLTRLEQGFTQLSRFSEDLAHEMRTPLSNLTGQTQQALSRDRTLAEYQNLLVSNQEEYERLAHMVDSMLFLARTEQPNQPLRYETIALQPMVAQLCDYFEGMAQERGISLLNLCHGQLVANPDLVRRALANLLANALRYAAPATPVTIRCAHTATSLTIQVHNLGEPITPEHLPYLFERFYRCDPSRNQPDDSGGLGLAIVKSIMYSHGGQIAVSSNEQEGTLFALSFPLSGAIAYSGEVEQPFRPT
ncbi:heavy metal sensor histidine kinase [Aeromonas hydrophila]|uniref:heavy metal sensor histidine kinase n=1 Tax=Aeromonas hydrophila TaxID=644 RepID=UPI003D22004E